jgi:hypothetical protein
MSSRRGGILFQAGPVLNDKQDAFSMTLSILQSAKRLYNVNGNSTT